MENVLLSIGSVCILKGSSARVMITGYFCPDYKNGIVVNDYFGCYYPYGVNCGVVVSFNASDIQEVLFQGYVDSKFMDFAEDFSAYKSRNVIETRNVFPSSVSGNIVNPFMTEEPNNSRVEISKDSQEWPIFNHVEFNSDGVITAAVENSEITNPAEILDKPTVIVDNNPTYDVTFDENGIVTSFGEKGKKTEEPVDAPVDPTKPIVKFDENGVVTEFVMPGQKTNTENTKIEEVAPDGTVYEFDENGMIIAVHENGTETPKTEETVAAPVDPTKPIVKFDENGVVTEFIMPGQKENADEAKTEEVAPEGPKYKFDENGIVIAEE